MRNSDARSRKNIVVTYTKKRIEIIFYLRFYKRNNLAQYSKLLQQKIQWSPDHSAKSRSPFYQRNYGHCFDESDVSLFIVNLNVAWTTNFIMKSISCPYTDHCPKRGHIATI